MSALTADFIYLGAWIDWTQGRIYGSTVTLSHRGGTLLLPFLATFTTFVFAQLWSIVAFIIYHARSRNRPADGLMHEEQAVLRNSGALIASWHFLMQASRWHGKSKHAVVRSVWWTSVALGFAAISGLASVFSAYTVSRAGQNRLINSQVCGYPVINGQQIASNALSAASYARTCYGTNAASVSECKRYIRTELAWAGAANVTCPFQSGMCSYGDQASFAMVTGPIDSLTDLGINSPPSERLFVKKSVICSGIREINHYRQVIDNSSCSNLVFYEFGPIGAQDTGLNYTHVYNRLAPIAQVRFALSATYSIATGPSPWEPVPELNRTDADVSIVFITPNSVLYRHPNDDPIFGASIPSSGSNYVSDNDVSTLACAEQYQVCNPATTSDHNAKDGNCSPWLGSYQLLMQAGLLNASEPSLHWPQEKARLTPLQIAIFLRVSWSLAQTSIYNIVSGRGASALRLADALVGTFQPLELSRDYWTREVSWWFEASLALLQQGIMDFAASSSVPKAATNNGSNIFGAYDKESRKMCSMQMTRDPSGDTMNFSALGLGIIFGVGTAIIVLAFNIEGLSMFFCNRFWPRKAYKGVAWQEDGFLKLHSRAFANNDNNDQDRLLDSNHDTMRHGKTFHFSALTTTVARTATPAAAARTSYSYLPSQDPRVAQFYHDHSGRYDSDYSYHARKNHYRAEQIALVERGQ